MTAGRRGPRPALVASLLLTALLGPGARAQDRGFRLRIAPCVAVRRSAVARQLTIELGSAPAQPAGPLVMDISCPAPGSQVALLRLLPAAADPAAAPPRTRLLDLGRLHGPLRERLLALAAAELLRGSPLDRPAPPPKVKVARPAPAALPPPPAPPLAAPRPPAAPRLRLVGLASGQLFPSGALALLGGGVALGGDSRHRLGWSAELIARHGSTAAPLGTITVDTLSAGVGAALWLGPPRLRLRGGLGLRGGLVRMRGEPGPTATGDALLGGWLGPAVVLGGSAILRRLVLEASAEAGYVALPITARAAGAPIAAIAGPFFGLWLGAGAFL